MGLPAAAMISRARRKAGCKLLAVVYVQRGAPVLPSIGGGRVLGRLLLFEGRSDAWLGQKQLVCGVHIRDRVRCCGCFGRVRAERPDGCRLVRWVRRDVGIDHSLDSWRAGGLVAGGRAACPAVLRDVVVVVVVVVGPTGRQARWWPGERPWWWWWWLHAGGRAGDIGWRRSAG